MTAMRFDPRAPALSPALPPALPGQATLRDFAGAFFTFALIADLAYVGTLVLMWQDFAAWMLLAGLVAAGLATLLWLAGLALYRHRPIWPVVGLNAAVLVAAILNALVHAGDGWTAIVPWGVGLSVLTCLLMLGAALLRRMQWADRP